jgi:hypothetical protein
MGASRLSETNSSDTVNLQVTSFSQGACVGYAHPRTLTATSPYIKSGFKSDLQVLRPTLMAAVPAILDLIAGGIKKKFSSGPVAALFHGAVDARMGKPGNKTSFRIDRLGGSRCSLISSMRGLKWVSGPKECVLCTTLLLWSICNGDCVAKTVNWHC